MLLCVGVFALCVAAFVYRYFYCPMPSEAREPAWKMMVLKGGFKLLGEIASIIEFLGLGSAMNVSRRLISTGLYYLNWNPFDNSVETKEELFGGVRVRIYRPRDTHGMLPGLIYIHGGGWITLSLDCYDRYLRETVKGSKVVAVSIDYRLAPENPFPVPFQDCLAASKHFLQEPDKYGVDKNRIAISGDSSGGNLALAVSLHLARNYSPSIPDLKAAIYIYPAAQALDFRTPSYQSYFDPAGFQILPSTTMIGFWSLYALGNDDQVERFYVNKHITPALKKSERAKYLDRKILPKEYQVVVSSEDSKEMTEEDVEFAKGIENIIQNPDYSPLTDNDENFKKLPGSVYILTADYDPLRDDGFFLANRFKNLGMKCVHKHWDRIEHGFLLGSFYKTTHAAIHEMNEFIVENL